VSCPISQTGAAVPHFRTAGGRVGIHRIQTMKLGYSDEGCVGGDGFVVACGDAPEVLYFVDETFDEMGLLVEMAIIRNCACAARFERGITAAMWRAAR
jgi:hypothetical protein